MKISLKSLPEKLFFQKVNFLCDLLYSLSTPLFLLTNEKFIFYKCLNIITELLTAVTVLLISPNPYINSTAFLFI